MNVPEPEKTSYYAPILVGALVFSFVMLIITNIVDEYVHMSPTFTGGIGVLIALAMGVPSTYAVHRVVRRPLITTIALMGTFCLLLSTLGNFLEHFEWASFLRVIPVFDLHHPLRGPLQNLLLLVGIVFFHGALALCVMRIERDCGALRDHEQRLNDAIRRADQERRKAQEYVDVAGVVLLALDADLRVTMMNPCGRELFGYSESELLGRACITLVPPEVREEARAGLAKFVGGGGVQRDPLLCKVRNKDGGDHTLSWAVRTLRDENGVVTGYLCSGTDVSEQYALERQMQQAQKLESLGVLAGGIAHDFNNLLVGIIGNLDLALTSEEDEPLELYLEDARTAGRRAVDLTQQMLAYAGRSSFSLGVVDLSTLVRETAALLKASISKKVTMTFDLAAALPPIRVDQTQIRQVVMNLITNAGDACADEDGEILIRTHAQTIKAGEMGPGVLGREPEPGVYAVLEVRDNGLGIDAATLRRIFEPFFSTKDTGHGLGLAAVLGIMRAHGGLLDVESTPGGGTTFRVYFPECEVDEASSVSVAAPEPEKTAGTCMVLIVEDEPIVRRTLSKLLRISGYEVVTASDGLDGIERFDENANRIQAVLLDLTMPRMDGREAYAVLRARRADLPIIVLSGYDSSETAGWFAPDPALAFLQKPFETDELIGTLARVTRTNRV